MDRRDFFKVTGLGVLAAFFGGLGAKETKAAEMIAPNGKRFIPAFVKYGDAKDLIDLDEYESLVEPRRDLRVTEEYERRIEAIRKEREKWEKCIREGEEYFLGESHA